MANDDSFFGAAARIWFPKQIQKCGHNGCSAEFRLPGSRNTCNACEKEYCDAHVIKREYFGHIPTAVGMVGQGKYLCETCLAAAPLLPKGWRRSIIEKTCSHLGCSESLRSPLTIKRSCKVCGLWYCSSHSDSSTQISMKWLAKKTKYSSAETVCRECAPSRDKSGPWEDFKTAFHDFNLMDKMTDATLLLGFRLALIGLSLMVLVGVAPTTYSVLNSEAIGVVQKLWNLFLCGLAGVYLTKEIIIEAMKRPSVRPYAITFSALAVAYVGYKLLFC